MTEKYIDTKNSNPGKQIWILEGYKNFAIHGETGLKIEKLAKITGVSKSSFYHHFADTELFLDQLFAFHIFQCRIIADKEKAVKKINPELINILTEHKIDLLFNRQLRFNQDRENYKTVLDKSNQIIGTDFVRIWAEDLNLALSNRQMEGLFELALENFFLRINQENITTSWLTSYFENLAKIAKNFE